MIDLSAKLAILTALAAACTWRCRPEEGAAAHRVWLLVLASPILFLAGAASASPIAYVQPSPGAWPVPIDRLGGDLPSWVTLVSGAVTVLLLARLGLGLLAVRRLVSDARVLCWPDLDRTDPGARGTGSVRLYEANVSTPATVGIWRPAILVPPDWRELSSDARAAVLHHEMAHVRRRDYLWTVLGEAVAACLWFHPCAWLALRRLRWFAELASDATAARSLDPDRYAGLLLKLAAGWRRAPALRPVGIGAASNVGRRIALLIAWRGRSRRRHLLTVVLLALAVLVLGAGWVEITTRVRAATSGAIGGDVPHEHGHGGPPRSSAHAH